MIGKSPNPEQKHLFLPNLNDFINPRHQLCRLADKIDWQQLEADFAPLYSTVGTPAKPVRLMIGLLILKQIYNLGDETVMAQWVANPYFQYFCGEVVFQWQMPCDPSDLVDFRHRIGVEGVEKILAVSISIHGKAVVNGDVSIDRGGSTEEYHVSDGHQISGQNHQAMPGNSRRRSGRIAAKLQIRGNGFVEKSEFKKSAASASKEESTQEIEDDSGAFSAGIETKIKCGKFEKASGKDRNLRAGFAAEKE